MLSRIPRFAWLLCCAWLLIALGACSGGGNGDTTPLPGAAFNLLLNADPTTGQSPLTVTFAAVPSGGATPYSFTWDFNGDSIPDSNAPTGTYVFTQGAQASVTVTDANGNVVTARRSIIITGTAPPPQGNNIDVRFTADPTLGSVPFNAQFDAVVTGGKQPYKYRWDFDADGTFDSFLKAPLYTFTKVGNKIDNNLYVVYPVLEIEDSRGVVVTNLDDQNNDGLPDFRVAINALPQGGGMITTANASPTSGQAPLSVEFTGSVAGVNTAGVEYRWDFGDNQNTAFTASSIASHIYTNAGTYSATVTAHDKVSGQVVTSAPVVITAAPSQTFGLTISQDTASGAVPFVVSFSANPLNGAEPIVYSWRVFNDVPDLQGNPGVGVAPQLAAAAVVTPDISSRKSPRIHFGNTAGSPGAFNYSVRCVAQDALGNTSVSNVLRVTAQARTNPADNSGGYYEAQRPNIVAFTTFPIFGDPTASANPVFQPVNPPVPWNPRANPAVCSHPAGVTFIMGGEILDANGRFQGLVSPGDSAFAYVPRAAATGTGQGAIGKYNQAGGMVLLNDNFGPAFPGQPDSPCPPIRDDTRPPAVQGPSGTNRSAPFTIVGSGAAVFMHEPPETNNENAYPPHGTPFDPNGDDQGVLPTVYGAGNNNPQNKYTRQHNHYEYPDSPANGWNKDGFPMPPPDGLGVPVIFVIGGRTGANTPTNLVQKYYPFGFGTEDIVPYSQDFSFETTNNQTDIWSPHFLRPDTDQWDGDGSNFDPDITARQSVIGDTGLLPTLPRALYGLMACRLETGADLTTPSFPNGPYRHVFVFGGIDENGSVRSETLWWDTTMPQDEAVNAGDKTGIFSELAQMPTPRAYGKAVFLPGNPMRIALVGGFDENGATLNSIDILTFDDAFNPTTGSWSTFDGTLPEALEALGAGYFPGPSGQKWILAMGGWNGEDINNDVFTARLGSPGSQVITEALPVAPRFSLGSAQSGAAGALATVPSFNRYYLVGGQDENAVENIIEIVSLP